MKDPTLQKGDELRSDFLSVYQAALNAVHNSTGASELGLSPEMPDEDILRLLLKASNGELKQGSALPGRSLIEALWRTVAPALRALDAFEQFQNPTASNYVTRSQINSVPKESELYVIYTMDEDGRLSCMANLVIALDYLARRAKELKQTTTY